MNARTDIADRLLRWFEDHGRRDLPWQHPRSGYRVWVSEIMLQQTQVATVIDYFNAFMARFPDIHTLAEAPADDVMRHWAGLGYYARARNLHAAAKQVVAEHGGELPADVDALMTLPGIGRSTAGAIRAQAFDAWAPILDGNAKRVLARYHGVDGAPGEAAFEKALWALAERETPHERVADYTQAIMDLGATLCTRRNPDCPACPLSDDCVAYRQGRQHEIPAARRRKRRPLRHTRMLVLQRGPDEILFQRRPPAGIWGGLWALPEVPAERDPETWCRDALGLAPDAVRELEPLRHGFTHFELEIRPLHMQVEDAAGIMDADDCAWHDRNAPPGVPAPIARLIRRLPETP
ncbi:A/G-specific adenine glycosylase [Salinisphaera sp. PC39]|uniref:A/G-specific adenine glycosylase n=1 Tax=Salinisphaera sp. PC39 TaxID=1304156 RepID=UPI0033422B47